MYTETELSDLLSYLAAFLQDRGLKLVCAESCTGGLIAGRITDLPGASQFFLGSFVTYSNDLKQSVLHVSSDILSEHGAVSRECAAAMAKGALRSSAADLALAVTGIAGPDGGSAAKPVGTVYIALATADHTKSLHYHFLGDRSAVRSQTVFSALELLARTLRDKQFQENC